MGLRFVGACQWDGAAGGLPVRVAWFTVFSGLGLLVAAWHPLPAFGQTLIRAQEPGLAVALLPNDLLTLESGQQRKDLPCTVEPRKPDLGFDLRFHSGYDVTIPLRELAGEEDVLTVVFRVTREGDREHATIFSQHIRVPAIEEDAKGDAALQGGFDLGEGDYHVDWLMRDRAERICSTSWDATAALPAKDRSISLLLPPGRVEQSQPMPSWQEDPHVRSDDPATALHVKLLVNFAPQNAGSAALQPSDTAALVSILKTIERDPRIGHVSLVAFNIQEHRVFFRQDEADHINFAGLGKALQSVQPGTVDLVRLSQKHGDTDFLSSLIEKEIGSGPQTDAVIFAGPKAMLNADVPQEDLQRVGMVECPMFYMNYNSNPQAVPWKDSISHAIRHFKGTEYTISRPRDLWFSTAEMLSRVVKAKRSKAAVATAAGGTR